MPLVVLRTPMGDRVMGITAPNIGQALSGGYFDADIDYDADRFFDADGVVLEESDRLLGLSGLSSSLRAVDGAILGSYTSAERGTVTAELHNGDKAMSAVVGQEYVLRQTLTAYATFPGLNVLEAMTKRSARVTRWVLTKRSLVVEGEQL